MIEIITELQAIAQTGLAYGQDKFDQQRYRRILEITAKLLSCWSSHKYENTLSLFEKEAGYATPKIDVRGAVFKENKILLVQESDDNSWTLPGGWADINLSAGENIIKEIREESGYDCSIIKLIGIYDKRKNIPYKRWPHIYKIFFLCQLENTKQFEFDRNEILNVDFFRQDSLPKLSESRINKMQLDLCFKHYQDQTLQSDFD